MGFILRKKTNGLRIIFHIHNNGWLSGVYYLDEPKVEKDKENAGWIEFNRSGYNLPHFGGEKEIKLIKPETVRLLLFLLESTIYILILI